MKITLIAAIDENNGIGKDNDLLCHLPKDMKFFTSTTMGHHILMGRKNYDSIPTKFRPLKGRKNIIVTRNVDYQTDDDIIVVNSIGDGIFYAKDKGEEELMIIGGANIYEQTINASNRLYITHIHNTFDADVYFPLIDPNIWQKVDSEFSEADEKNPYDMEFATYEKF